MKKIIYSLCLLLITLTSKAQLPPYIPTSGLIAWYSFSGNTNDSSGNSLNGTIYGGVLLTTDRFGNPNSAYNFDGTTGYIGVPSNSLLKLKNQYSISGWFDATTIPTNQRTIVSQSMNSSTTGLCLNLDNLQNYNVFGDNTDSNGTHTISADTTPVVNTWYNVVITYDSVNLKIYVDGILKNSLPYTINLSNNLHILTIGSQHVTSNSDDFFSGKLDDIGVWSRALTQQEVQNLYTGNSPCTYYDTTYVIVTDTLVINVNSGINTPNIDTLKVYPNPTSNQLFINTGNYSNLSGYTLKIINSLSQVEFQSSIDQQIFDISLSGWAKGTYLLEIFNTQNSLVETRTIILQ